MLHFFKEISIKKTILTMLAIITAISVNGCSPNYSTVKNNNENHKEKKIDTDSSSETEEEPVSKYYLPFKDSKLIKTDNVNQLIGKDLGFIYSQYEGGYLHFYEDGTFVLRDSNTFGDPAGYADLPEYPDSSSQGQTFCDTVYYGKYNMTGTGYIAMNYQYSILFLYGFDNYNKPKSSINKDIIQIIVYGNSESAKNIEENYSNLPITGSGKDDITFKVEINDKNQATFTQINGSTNKYILLESDNRRKVTSLDDMLQLNISNSDLTIY